MVLLLQTIDFKISAAMINIKSGKSCGYYLYPRSSIYKYPLRMANSVGIIDSGVLNTTEDLNLNTLWSKSFVDGEGAFEDGLGHGTHVSGTVAALANGKGVVGVAPGAEIISRGLLRSWLWS